MERTKEAAATMRMGGGIGYDFSTLRPRGALVRKLQSQSSGPVSFMEIFDAVCRGTASSGHRRGAQMAVLRIDHPDIEEFIHAKQNNNHLTGFNVSVAVTDVFMDALKTDSSFDLVWEGQVHKTVSATDLWETIMRSTWDWAEPGVLFIDTINRMNNLWYCETISATNPCGEQPLPPHGACLLGSFNLVKYLTEELGKFHLDLDQLRADIKPVVRAMDNVIDVARYPLRSQELEAKRKRRMGLGITGLANALEACGHPYGSPSFLAQQEIIQQLITTCAYQASANLADEKGAFPEYKSDLYGKQGFVSTLGGDT
ncbi:MAG: adenosylcobalamin-dependent ribonucleoside-diphosphate reductase, partial [bacterium]